MRTITEKGRGRQRPAEMSRPWEAWIVEVVVDEHLHPLWSGGNYIASGVLWELRIPRPRPVAVSASLASSLCWVVRNWEEFEIAESVGRIPIFIRSPLTVQSWSSYLLQLLCNPLSRYLFTETFAPIGYTAWVPVK